MKINKSYKGMLLALGLTICSVVIMSLTDKGTTYIPIQEYSASDGLDQNVTGAIDPKMAQESKTAFMKAYNVFMHPRCMNCHPKGDAPLQGDDSHIHTQNVKRGPDGKGLYALKCTNCHQMENTPGEHMPPGHEIWQLPPPELKMIFEGKSPKELAEHLKNNEFTGFKSWAEDLIHHVEHEPLVAHSWTYGTPPPISHEEFVASVKEWIEKGAVIPD